ncbi:MAG TPA: non-homologous end-joining DNA ligase [Candidatus Acidoferrum sp.]|nr:non-homologous end-joining DNA ligase [Candidatus Acidoferrum sp.]
MADILDPLHPDARRRARRSQMPAWVDPMLATLTDRRFSDQNWIYEHKLDGERCLAFKQGRTVRLLSRNQQHLNNTYPEITDGLQAAGDDDAIVDGEVVAFDGNRTSFARLQGRIGIKDPDEARRTGIPVFYYVFDLVYVDGYDITAVGLIDRKNLLQRALEFRSAVRFMTHRNTEGEVLYREACQQGLEGLIAKRRDSPYVHGRSPDWLKFKCINEQEMVIGGFTDPAGSRVGLGALLVGYYEQGKLCYAGKVGTGFDTATLLKLRSRLDARETKRSPFPEEVREKGSHWVRPDLVAQIGFTEWTHDGKLRHPRFLGIRTDKAAKDVVRERPQLQR